MKKTFFLVIITLMLSAVAFSQVAIGTTTPATDAVLELSSPNKALLVPRVANTAAVAAPVNGMIIYDISSNCIKKYQNGVWSECNATTAPMIATLDCSTAVVDGVITSGIATSGTTVSLPYTSGNGGTYSGQIISSTGVTGLYATLLMGTLANGDNDLIYTITGTPIGSGIASFAVNFLGKSCSFDITVEASTPQVLSLDCAAAALSGALTANTFAGGTFVSFGYTGGNGTAYGNQSIASTGVTGLTANLSSGTLANGSGMLVFSLAGTPASGGVASFALSLGGQSCNFTVNVDAPPSISSWSNCSAATTGSLVQGVPASGVTQTTSYTGGNGGNYPASSISSGGVSGLVANLAAGNLANGVGNLVFTITGTPSSSGTATFNLTLFGASCTFSRTVAAPTITALTCGSASFTPTDITLNSTYSGTMTVPYTGGNAATYPAGSAINSAGVTGLTATLQAGTLANGTGGSLVYSISGTPSSGTTASFAINFGGQNCTVNKNLVIPAPLVSGLTCGSPVFTPATITQNVAYSGSFTVTYSGGNNVPYAAGSAINSTGVSGLTATLQAGSLSNNSGGTLTYNVTGTPTTSGTASFALSFGGQNCTVSKAVAVQATISGLTCGSATFSTVAFTSGAAYSGTATVPYTGGNAAAYGAGSSIASTGITGLTATLQAGTLANGAGNLTYTISGTPSGNGLATFALNFGGQSCSINLSSCGALVSGTFKIFMCHNMGANASLNPFTYQSGAINGDLYQWGRPTDGHQIRTSTTIATQATNNTATLPATVIGKFIDDNNNWRNANITTLWGDGTTGVNPAKAANDPCPPGFKVPSQAQWGGTFRGGILSGAPGTATQNVWTWTGNGFTVGPYLYLPAAGYRNLTNGSLVNVGSEGAYYSSTVVGTKSFSNYFSSTNIRPGYEDERAYGDSVRCIQE